MLGERDGWKLFNLAKARHKTMIYQNAIAYFTVHCNIHCRPANFLIPARPLQPRVTQPSAPALATIRFPPANATYRFLYLRTSRLLGLINLDPNTYISNGPQTYDPSFSRHGLHLTPHPLNWDPDCRTFSPTPSISSNSGTSRIFFPRTRAATPLSRFKPAK